MMFSERELFAKALEIENATERARFLDSACGEDVQLRRRIEEELNRAFYQIPLTATGGVSGPEPPAPEDATLAATRDIGPAPFEVQQIGPYRLREKIGEGGFGIVYLAEQTEPVRRRVALKVIKPGMDSREVIARFEAERQALALMDHPNIARVIDAGTTEHGRPYFVMELVRGVSMTQFCDDARLDVNQRLQLFIDVCRAVQHAHQKGIIHRDLKPSNVLVTQVDGKPTVKVIDFGVAKALHQQLADATVYTRYAQMIGTPLYMSPEQAEMSNQDIDTRSDIYSLGVILYELLTGSTPFGREQLMQAALDEMRRIIREVEPPKPSTRLSESGDRLPSIAAQRHTEPLRLSRLLRGDLDWIVMKSLEKSRSRRYQSPAEFASDIESFLEGDIVSARPPSTLYRIGKYVRRHKGLVASSASIFLMLLLAIAGTSWGMFRANLLATQRDNMAKTALAEEQKATRNARLHAMAAREAKTALESLEANLAGSSYYYQMAIARWESDRAVEALTFLEKVPPKYRRFEWFLARNQIDGGSLKFKTPISADCGVFSPDGNRIFLGGHQGVVARDLITGEDVWKNNIGGIRRLFLIHDDTRILASADYGNFKLLSTDSGDLIWEEGLEEGNLANLSNINLFDATPGPDGSITLWGRNEGDQGLTRFSVAPDLRTDDGTFMRFGPVDTRFNSQINPWRVAICRDGRFIATCKEADPFTSGRILTVWDVSTGREVWSKTVQRYGDMIEFSPKGTLIVLTTNDTIVAYRASDGEELYEVKNCRKSEGIRFSPDESRLVCEIGKRELASALTLFDACSGKRIGILNGWRPTSRQPIEFSPDGGRIFGQGEGDTIETWNGATGDRVDSLKGVGEVAFFAFSPDGSRMCVDGSSLWDISGPVGYKALRWDSKYQDARCFDVSSDGNWAVSSGDDGTARSYRHALTLWNTNTGERVWTHVGQEGNKNVDDSTINARFSPDGSRIVSVDNNGTIILWDVTAGKALKILPTSEKRESTGVFAFSPDSSLLVAGGIDKTITIVNASDGTELRSFVLNDRFASAVTFGSDQKTVLSIGGYGKLEQWNLATGEKILECEPFERGSGAVCALQTCPDGVSVVIRSGYGDIVRSDLKSGQTSWARNIENGGWSDRCHDWCLSPNGVWLAVDSRAGTLSGIVLLDANTGEIIRNFGGRSLDLDFLQFSPDSSRLVAWDRASNSVKLWDPATGEELRSLGGPEAKVEYLSFQANGEKLVAAGKNIVKTWAAYKHQQINTLAGHKSHVASAFLDPAGTRAVSRSLDGMVKLWDVLSKEEIWTRQLSAREFEYVAFDSEAKRIVVKALNGPAHFLDIETGEQLPGESSATANPSGFLRATENWEVRPWGNDIQLIDLKYNQRPERGEILLENSAAISFWHKVQAEKAALDENCYAEAFHLSWVAKIDTTDTKAISRLKDLFAAFSTECENRKVDAGHLLAPVMKEFFSQLKNDSR